jgi:hypothetical protein
MAFIATSHLECQLGQLLRYGVPAKCQLTIRSMIEVSGAVLKNLKLGEGRSRFSPAAWRDMVNARYHID